MCERRVARRRSKGSACEEKCESESNPKPRPNPKPSSADVAERGVALIGVCLLLQYLIQSCALICQRPAAVATSAYSGVTVAPTVVFAVRCLPMCGVNRSTNRVRGLPMCGVYRSTNRRLRSVATLGALLQVLCRLPVACAAVLLPPLLTHARALDVPCGELALGVMRPRTLL